MQVTCIAQEEYVLSCFLLLAIFAVLCGSMITMLSMQEQVLFEADHSKRGCTVGNRSTLAHALPVSWWYFHPPQERAPQGEGGGGTAANLSEPIRLMKKENCSDD